MLNCLVFATRRSPWHLTFMTMLAPIAWGTTYIIFSEVLPAERSILTAAWRVTPAGVLLILVGAITTRWRPHGAEWRRLALLSLLNFVIFFPLLILAADRLPGGVAATAGGLQPLLVATLGSLSTRMAPRPLDLAVGVVAAIGVALVVIRPGAAYDTVGVLAAIGANVAFAAAVVLTRRFPTPRDPIGAAGWQLLFSAAALIPLSLALEGTPPQLTQGTLAGFSYVSVVATAVAYVFWFNGIRKLPATAPPLLGLAAPLTGVILGWAILEQSLRPSQILGFVITLGAIAFGSMVASNKRVNSGRGDTCGHHAAGQSPEQCGARQ